MITSQISMASGTAVFCIIYIFCVISQIEALEACFRLLHVM